MRRAHVVALAAAITLVPAASAEAAFNARGSVQQVQVTGAKKGSKLILMRNGHRVAVKRAGKLGGAVFRNLKPGKGYKLRAKRLTVFPNRSKPPSTKLYKQKIPASGYGYLRTRDGTKLAIDVRVPARPRPVPDGDRVLRVRLCQPGGRAVRDQPGPQPARLRGGRRQHSRHRVLGRRVRLLRAAAGPRRLRHRRDRRAQPWVLHHKVGMAGVSYGGISQLFVAETRPPSLAAITPLSVIDNTQTTL